VFAYQVLLVCKFLSVMGFAGGATAAFLTKEVSERKRAVHHVASPCLLAVWLAGYALLILRGWPLFELWIIGSLALSLSANVALGYCAARGRRDLAAFAGVVAPVAVTVGLMVFKPTWAQVSP